MRIPPLISIALSVAAMALLLWPAYSSPKAYAELFDILPTHTSTAPNISTSMHPVGLHSLLDLSMVQANTIRTLFVLPCSVVDQGTTIESPGICELLYHLDQRTDDGVHSECHLQGLGSLWPWGHSRRSRRYARMARLLESRGSMHKAEFVWRLMFIVVNSAFDYTSTTAPSTGIPVEGGRVVAVRFVNTCGVAELCGGGREAPKRQLWHSSELRAYRTVGNPLQDGTYRPAAYLSEQSIDLIPENVSGVCIPLSVLLPRVTRSLLTEVAIQHHVTTSRRHWTIPSLLSLFEKHNCDACPQYYTLFELYSVQPSAVRSAKWRAAVEGNDTKRQAILDGTRQRVAEHRVNKIFPPAPATLNIHEAVISGFCNDTKLELLEERGCAVCGQLTNVHELQPMSTYPYGLECLINPLTTRKERTTERDPVTHIDGPVLDKSCSDICNTCTESLAQGTSPPHALANGLWLGNVPEVLNSLYWTEKLLIARVMHNYCVIRVRSSGMHRMRANAICHALPMPRVYSVLPPPRDDMDDVLAFMYIGPTAPTPEDYLRTPFLVRRNKVRNALDWLKLNHADYQDITISTENLDSYPEDRPPVIVDFHMQEATKDAEATAVNDSDEADGTTEGMCSFVVHTLTPDEAETLMKSQDRSTLRAKAVEHFKKGGSALAIGHAADPESLYNNPQLYPQMFPWLYPYGLGGIGNPYTVKTVGDVTQKRLQLMYHDKRFQLDAAFPLIALNHTQIKDSTLGGYLLTHKRNFAEVADRILRVTETTLSEVIKQLEDKTFLLDPSNKEQAECMKLIGDIDYVASRVDGSVTARKQMRTQIWSLTSFLGAPSWFITFAPADVNHPIALYFAGTDTTYHIDIPSRSERERLIANNPVAGARFFKVIVDAFLKHVLGVGADHPGLYGKTQGYYGTVEQQGRLTLHLHMLVWIKGAMTPQEIRDRIIAKDSEFQKRIVEYLESLHVGEFIDSDMEEMKDNIGRFDTSHEETARATLRMPDSPPLPGTCASACTECTGCKNAEPWWARYRATVNELLYRSNTHDCRHGCKDNKYGTCKARFPRDTPEVTKFDMDTGAIIQKKGEAWMNWFTPSVTYLLRCNTDVTHLMSGTAIKAVIAYVTDYITKTPLKSHVMFDAVRKVFRRDADQDVIHESKQIQARKVITKTVNSLTVKSEIGGPMACMYLLGHPDHYTNFRFRKLYWRSYVKHVSIGWNEAEPEHAIDPDAEKAKEQVMLKAKGSDIVPFDYIMDYTLRPYEYQDLCLYDWVRRSNKQTSRKANQNVVDGKIGYTVAKILRHKWSRNKCNLWFEVQWQLGDHTWESYTSCKRLRALDEYFETCGVTDRSELPMQEQFSEVEILDVLGSDDSTAGDEIEGESRAMHNMPFVDMPISGSESDDKDSKWCMFLYEHPQFETHSVNLLSEKDAYVPEFAGGSLPRSVGGDRDAYCKTMLTLFKSWRKPIDLRTEESTWAETFERHEFTPRQEELMKFFNIRYECNDSRDDYSKQRKAAGSGDGIPFRDDMLAALSHEGYFDDSLKSQSNDNPEDDEHINNVVTAAHLSRLDEMRTIEGILKTSGALDDLAHDNEEVIQCEELIAEHGGDLTASQWQKILKAKRTEILKQRTEQSLREPSNEQEKPPGKTTAQANIVKVIDQSYLEKGWTAPDESTSDLLAGTISQYKLNEEQRRAFSIVAHHASRPSGEHLKMYLGGMAGTGKSQVIKALIHFFQQRGEQRRFTCVAPTGAAAALINGSTYHSALSFYNGKFDSTRKAIQSAEEALRDVDYLFVDEVSMIDPRALYEISARMAQARKRDDEPFGGINVIFAGDFAQLPPVGGSTLYGAKVTSTLHHTSAVNVQKALIGKAIWHQITTVVILRQNMRQNTASENDSKLRTALEHLRYRDCTKEDINMLFSRVVGRGNGAPSLADPRFRHVSIITSHNVVRDRINELSSQRFAKDNNRTLHTFYSFDRIVIGKDKNVTATGKDGEDGLKPAKRVPRKMHVPTPHLQNVLWNLPHGLSRSHAGKLSLCLGMPVMLKHNMATECGVTNGAEAIVVGWQDRSLGGDRRMLDTVFVQLINNPVPVKLDGLPTNVVPVTRHGLTVPCTVPWQKEPLDVLREQVPLVPNFSMTDYGSQGRTRKYNVIDIQSCKSHLAVYTCLSRGTSYDGTVILRSFPLDNLQGGITGWLRQEFRELELLDDITRLRFLGMLPNKVYGNARTQLIHSYRTQVGEKYFPESMPVPLRWTSKDRFTIVQDSGTLPQWQIVDGKTAKATSNNGLKSGIIVAKASSVLHRVSSVRPEKGRVLAKHTRAVHTKSNRVASARTAPTATSTVVHVSTPSERAHLSTPSKRPLPAATPRPYAQKRARLVAPTASETISPPQGFRWDAANYSCAYDSLFTLLLGLYQEDQVWWNTAFARQNHYLRLLTAQFNLVRPGSYTLEEARDEVRAELSATDPLQFPLTGRSGTDIYALCRFMLGSISRPLQWTANCSRCNLSTALSDMEQNVLYECTTSVWRRRSNRLPGRESMRTSKEWLLAFSSMITDQTCYSCNQTLHQHLGRMSAQPFLVFTSPDRLIIQWEPTLDVGDETYRLFGLIYYGEFHFTCRLVDRNGAIWFHDGQQIQRDCTYQGSIQNATPRMIQAYKKGRACVALYCRLRPSRATP